MDEFDMFMDLGTRERAIEQIMAFAEANKSRQFILITPQVSYPHTMKKYLRWLLRQSAEWTTVIWCPSAGVGGEPERGGGGGDKYGAFLVLKFVHDLWQHRVHLVHT